MTADPDLDASTPGDLPGHADAGVAAIEAIHVRHERKASAWQRRLEAMTRAAAQPLFCAVTALCLAAWIAWHIGWHAGAALPDPRQFEWLEGVGTWAALFMTALILATQRRADEFAEARERLMLELALLSEQKTAKLIEMIDALRRDLPDVGDPHDPEARAMAHPADPEVLFDAVDPATPGRHA